MQSENEYLKSQNALSPKCHFCHDNEYELHFRYGKTICIRCLESGDYDYALDYLKRLYHEESNEYINLINNDGLHCKDESSSEEEQTTQI